MLSADATENLAPVRAAYPPARGKPAGGTVAFTMLSSD